MYPAEPVQLILGLNYLLERRSYSLINLRQGRDDVSCWVIDNLSLYVTILSGMDMESPYSAVY